jgi:hypothetical protein
MHLPTVSARRSQLVLLPSAVTQGPAHVRICLFIKCNSNRLADEDLPLVFFTLVAPMTIQITDAETATVEIVATVTIICAQRVLVTI